MLKGLKAGMPPLKLSIQKWQDIAEEVAEEIELKVPQHPKGVDVSSISVGSKTCALCEMYGLYACDGCIIHESTGETDCFSTPFKPFIRAYNKGNLPAMLEAAIAEVDFLESLEE